MFHNAGARKAGQHCSRTRGCDKSDSRCVMAPIWLLCRISVTKQSFAKHSDHTAQRSRRVAEVFGKISNTDSFVQSPAVRCFTMLLVFFVSKKTNLILIISNVIVSQLPTSAARSPALCHKLSAFVYPSFQLLLVVIICLIVCNGGIVLLLLLLFFHTLQFFVWFLVCSAIK